MKISIEQKETKEIEIEPGYYKNENNGMLFKIEDGYICVVSENFASKWNFNHAIHYVEYAIQGQPSTEAEFKNMFDKAISYIKSNW